MEDLELSEEVWECDDPLDRDNTKHVAQLVILQRIMTVKADAFQV